MVAGSAKGAGFRGKLMIDFIMAVLLLTQDRLCEAVIESV